MAKRSVSRPKGRQSNRSPQDEFQVGEIAVFVKSLLGPEAVRIPIGAEVEIVGPLEVREVDWPEGRVVSYPCYLITFGGEPPGAVAPDQLRKRGKPRGPLAKTTWDKCAWKPRIREVQP